MTNQSCGKIGASCHAANSSALMGASKSSAIQILPLSAPGSRFFCTGFSSGASRAMGFPALAIITSSPAAARSTRRERWVLASWILTVCIMSRPPFNQTKSSLLQTSLMGNSRNPYFERICNAGQTCGRLLTSIESLSESMALASMHPSRFHPA